MDSSAHNHRLEPKSLVVEIQSLDPSVHMEACGRFSSIFHDPLVALLCSRRKYLEREDAKDLVSEFIKKRVIEERFLDKFDPAYGGKPRKLYHFVCRNFNWFCGDEEKKPSLKTGPLGLDPPGLNREELPTSQSLDESIFEYVLAANLLFQSLLAVKADCHDRRQEDVWNVFSIRVIEQALKGGSITHAEIAKRLGLKNAKRSSHLLESGQQKFKSYANRILRESEPGANNRTPEDLLLILAKPPLPNFDLCQHLEKLAELSTEDSEIYWMKTGEELKIAAESWLNDREVAVLNTDELNWRQILNQTVSEYQNIKHSPKNSASLSFSVMMSHSDEKLSDLLFLPTSQVAALDDIRKATKKHLKNCTDTEAISMHTTVYLLVHTSDIICYGKCKSKNGSESLVSNIKVSLSNNWLDEQSRWQLNEAIKLLTANDVEFPRFCRQ